MADDESAAVMLSCQYELLGSLKNISTLEKGFQQVSSRLWTNITDLAWNLLVPLKKKEEEEAQDNL